LIYADDGSQFIFVQTERFFAEDVLPFRKRRENLVRVQVVTSCDYHSVDRGVMDDSSGFGRAIAKPE